jgi:hypothetical protein
MRHLTEETEVPVVEVGRTHRVGRSPVRRSLGRSPFLRLFRFNIA